MIVPTMSFEQMFDEVMKERAELNAKAQALYAGVRRNFLKTGNENSTISTEIFSARKNHYYLFYKIRKNENRSDVSFLLHTNDNNGFRTLQPMKTGNDDELHIITGHFYRRYNERCSLGFVKPLDMIKHFHKNNEHQDRGHFEEQEIGKPAKVFSSVTNGVMLGLIYLEKNVTVYKTFIHRNMLFKEQREALNYLKHLKKMDELILIEDEMEQKMDDERKNWMAHR